MGKMELIKPKAIVAFEKRFKTEADHCEDVFYLRLASSWQDFFRSVFCFVNDGGFQEQNVVEVKDYKVSLKGVTFGGRLSFHNVWGSDCVLVQGKLKTPSPDRLIMEINDGVYLLSPAGSDVWDIS